MSHWTPISPWKLGAVQKVTVGASHAETSAFTSTQTRAVLLVATTDCHIRIEKGAVAAATDTLLKAAHPPIVLGCTPEQVVSVIQDTAGGFLYVTELSH